MPNIKCFSCKNKGPITHLEEAAKCENCNAYYHGSCFQRAKEGSFKCCNKRSSSISSDNNVTANQPLDRDFLKNELQAMRNDIIHRIDSLETKLESRLSTVEKQSEKHDNDILDLSGRLDVLELSSGKVKDELENAILAEVADRCQRVSNAIIYNLEEKDSNNDDILALLENFAGAPFKTEDIRAFRIGSKEGGNTRPLKVMFRSKSFAHWLITHSKQGVDVNIKCVPDRTSNQRAQFKKLVEELNQRKSNGEKDIMIKHINGIPTICNKRDSSKNDRTNH